MTDIRKAAEQALAFCEFLWRDVSLNDYAEELRQSVEDALLAALAKPQDEPVAWMVGGCLYGHYDEIPFRQLPPVQQPLPLYTYPAPQRKPLSDAEIEAIAVETEDAGHGWAGDMNRISNHGFFTADSLRAFVRAVEKLHGIT